MMVIETRRRGDTGTRRGASPRRRVSVSPRPIANTDVFAISRPARAFTGDFYQYANISDGLWLALGDVAGKGLHAAVFMAMIHEELERLSSCDADLSEIMRSINLMLREQMPRNRFASMTLATICTDGVAMIANAGHPPALIRREDGSVEPVHSHGPALALFDSGSWQPASIRLSGSDTLVLYSDGLLEATAPDGQEFGLERIVDALRNSEHSPRQLANSVLAAAERYTGNRFSDDLTLLAARVPTSYPAA